MKTIFSEHFCNPSHLAADRLPGNRFVIADKNSRSGIV
jgi:hypothetical protein